MKSYQNGTTTTYIFGRCNNKELCFLFSNNYLLRRRLYSSNKMQKLAAADNVTTKLQQQKQQQKINRKLQIRTHRNTIFQERHRESGRLQYIIY